MSVDSIFCHANWGKSLGGISFPLLADFHPKGAMASDYGLYLKDNGITDRATVIVDAGGTVRYAHSVTPSGQRDIDELVELCAGVNAAFEGPVEPAPAAEGIADATLFVKSDCGFSRAALLARDNLHLDQVAVRNVTESAEAMSALESLAGSGQAPCLILDGKPVPESKEIVEVLVSRAAPL